MKRALKVEPLKENQKQRLHTYAKIALAGAVWEHRHRQDEPQVTALLQAAHAVYEVPGMSEPCEQKWLARWLQKRRLGAQWESIVGSAGAAPAVESE